MLDEKTTLPTADETADEPLSSDGFAKMLGVEVEKPQVEEEPDADDEIGHLGPDDDEAEPEDDEDGDPQEEPEPEPEPDPKPEPKPDQPAQKMLTEAEVNAIVADRLARDRRVKEVREAEALMGKPLAEVLVDLRKQKIETLADTTGMTEQEATRIVEAEEKLRIMEGEQAQLKEEQTRLARVGAYQQAKAKYTNEPLAKRYEREVEAFSQQGSNIDYEPALFYILGKQLVEGDLRDFLRTNTEQQTVANVAKRSKTRVEGGGQAPRAPESRLSGVERSLAHRLLDDVTDKPETAFLRAKPKK